MSQRNNARRRSLGAPIVLASAVMMSACGGGGVYNPGPRTTPLGKWVVMGSSTAEGTGATTSAKSWAGLLQAGIAAQVQVINIAKGGTTTYAGLPTSSTPPADRESPDPTANVTAALTHAPKALLISYPTNDTASDYSATETVDNLLAMRAVALASNVKVIMLSTQPRDLSPALLARLEEIDVGVSAVAGACFVAVRADLAGLDSKLNPAYDSGDAIHPNDAGHALIHQRVRALIDSGDCLTLGAP